MHNKTYSDPKFMLKATNQRIGAWRELRLRLSKPLLCFCTRSTNALEVVFTLLELFCTLKSRMWFSYVWVWGLNKLHTKLFIYYFSIFQFIFIRYNNNEERISIQIFHSHLLWGMNFVSSQDQSLESWWWKTSDTDLKRIGGRGGSSDASVTHLTCRN